MTLNERVRETMKRLDFVTTMKMSPDDWHGFLVAIIKDARQDGIEAEREACAGIVEEEYRQSLLRNDPNPGIDPLLTATKIRAHKSKGD